MKDTWTIFSIGDPAFLFEILNAVAMIAGFNDGGTLRQIASIGMIFGVLLMGFQSIAQGGSGIKFQTLIIAWIVFVFMFGRTVTTVVEDAYAVKSGSSSMGHSVAYVVDNVPQGLAISGSMLSTIGYKTTEIMEQAFSTPGMTDTGFASSLQFLAASRKMMMTPASLRGANDPNKNGDDYWQSWRNYISECTFAGVDRGQINLEQVLTNSRAKNEGIMQQLFFDNGAFGTKLILSDAPTLSSTTGCEPVSTGNELYCTCRAAFGVLSAKTNSHFYPSIMTTLYDVLVDPTTNVADPTSITAIDDGIKLSEAERIFGNYWSSIVQRDILTSNVEMQDYMVASALYPMFYWATTSNELDFHREGAASILHSSIQSRNTQWSAEQGLFQSTVKPMMTFFEGLIYGITPFVAFLIGLGPMGIKLIGKYLLLALWIQLWMPTMSIINLFLNMSITSRMYSLSEGRDLPLDSFYGIHALDQEVQTWVSTAGMLSASVPGITLMLIYGSAVTATSLAARLSQTPVNTSEMAPPLAQNSPVTQNAPRSVQDHTSTMSSGANRNQKMLQISDSRSSTISNMESQVESDRLALSQTAQQAARESMAYNNTDSYGFSASWAHQSNGSEGYSTAANAARTALDKVGLSSAFTEDQRAAMAMNASVGGTLGGFFKGTGASTSADGSYTFTNAQGEQQTITSEQADTLQKALTTETSKASVLSTAVSNDYREGNMETWTAGVSQETASTLSNTAETSVTNSNQIADISQQNSQFTTSQSIEANDLPNIIANNNLGPQLDSYYNSASPEFKSSANAHADQVRKNNPAMKPEDASNVGVLFAMADGNHLQGMSVGEKLQTLQKETPILGAIFGSQGNQGMNTTTESLPNNNLSSSVQDRVGPAENLPDQSIRTVPLNNNDNQGIESARNHYGQTPFASLDPADQKQVNDSLVQASHQADQQQFTEQNTQTSASNLLDAANTATGASKFYESVDPNQSPLDNMINAAFSSAGANSSFTGGYPTRSEMGTGGAFAFGHVTGEQFDNHLEQNPITPDHVQQAHQQVSQRLQHSGFSEVDAAFAASQITPSLMANSISGNPLSSQYDQVQSQVREMLYPQSQSSMSDFDQSNSTMSEENQNKARVLAVSASLDAIRSNPGSVGEENAAQQMEILDRARQVTSGQAGR